MSVRFTTFAPRAIAWVAGVLLVSQLAGQSAARAPSALDEGNTTGNTTARESAAALLASAVSYNPAERELLVRAEAGKLGPSDLFAAALVASGADEPEKRRFYEARLRLLAERLQRRIREVDDRATDLTLRASLVHSFLHEVILTGTYDLGCSRISQAMDTGCYNCVSATILFNVLAAEAGLETSGGESPAHVVSIVRLPDGPLHVETTCPRWFELRGGNTQAPTATAPSASVRAAPRNYRGLDVPQLVALLYYNIGVDFAEQRRYADALAANDKALRLDPSSGNARANLLAAINNWALELAQQERFSQAAELIAEGRRIAPDHPTFAVNDAAVRERWVRSLCQRGQWAQAEAVLDQAAAEYPGHVPFGDMKRQIAEHRTWHEEPSNDGRDAPGAGAAITE